VGVFLPLSVPLPLRLIPESLGAGGCAGFRPAAGRFAGGAGGVGLPRTPLAPFVFAAGGGGGGVGRIVGGAGAGGGATSSRYAEGAQPSPVAVLTSHQPERSVRILN
jgi:hypothetical protein